MTETGAVTFGKRTPEPERHFVPEVRPKGWIKGQPEGSTVKSKTGWYGLQEQIVRPGMQPAKITVTRHLMQLRLQKVNGNYSK